MTFVKNYLSSFLLFLFFLTACNPGRQIRQEEGLAIPADTGPWITIPDDTRKSAEDIKIEWLYPKEREIKAYNEVYIELKITSSEPISEGDVKVLVDGLNILSKAGETTLLPKGKELIFSSTVRLDRNRPMNAVKIEVTNKNGIKKSRPLFVAISERPETEISWIKPNVIGLAGQPYILHSEILRIELNIETPNLIRKQDIRIVYNNEKMPSGNNALLEGKGGRYTFTEFIKIDRENDFQTVYVEVRGKPSEALKFNFVPLSKPNLYIVSIGTNAEGLKYTVKDAKDFANLFRNQGDKSGNRLFGSVRILPILGEAATSSEIKGTIEELKVKYVTGNIKINDVITIFLSSHGFIIGEDFRIQGNDFKSTRRESTSVSYKEDIVAVLEQIPCKKLIIIDACQSGAAKGAKGLGNYEINQAIQQLNRVKSGFITIASSYENESSYEDKVWQNGAFTEAIVKGLKYAKADADRDKIITVGELFSYIEQEVPKLVESIMGKIQHPKMTKNEIGDIPIYIVEK